jgi:hypothetical protein
VPLKVAVCVLPATLLLLSVTTSVAPRLPGAAGVKVTAIVQEVLTARVVGGVPHVVFSLKSPGLVPVNPMLAIFKVASPVLLRVKVSAPLAVISGCGSAKALVVGERLASGAVPVPFKVTVCGLGVAVSLKFNVAVRLPAVVGVNVTPTVQVLGDGAVGTVIPVQLSELLAKSPGFVPVSETLVMVTLALPPLVRVTICTGVLVVPTAWLPNVKVEAERPTDPSMPVPIKLTACGLPAVALSAILTAAVRLPEAEGVKVTVMVQLRLAPSELPQVLPVRGEKSPLLVPVTETTILFKLTLPVFVSVMTCGVLGVPTP